MHLGLQILGRRDFAKVARSVNNILNEFQNSKVVVPGMVQYNKSIVDAFSSFQNLSKLSLRGCNLTNVTFLNSTVKLRFLDLGCNRFDRGYRVQSLALFLSKQCFLESLDLNGCHMEMHQMLMAVTNLSNCVKLAKLDLSWNGRYNFMINPRRSLCLKKVFLLCITKFPCMRMLDLSMNDQHFGKYSEHRVLPKALISPSLEDVYFFGNGLESMAHQLEIREQLPLTAKFYATY
eukprot:762539-Hanusia_phi.AAC.4